MSSSESAVESINHDTDVCVLQTMQTGPIRNLITAFKDLVTDLNITITKKELRIISMDRQHTVLVDACIKFDLHHCTEQKIFISVNALYLFKLISKVTPNDVLGLHISRSKYNDGSVSDLGIQFDNAKHGQQINYSLRLQNPEESEIPPPIDVEYDSISTMPSTGLQKIIQLMNGVSDRVRIESVGSAIIFSAVGGWADTRITRGEFVEGGAATDPTPSTAPSTATSKAGAEGADKAGVIETVSFKKKPDATMVIRGEFSYKSLANVSRMASLSPVVEIRMANNRPLMISYSVGSDMGKANVYISSLPQVSSAHHHE